MHGMAQALRAAARRGGASGAEEKDILAFLALSLDELQKSVAETTSAWERREYWVKADRFRLQWDWVPRILARLEAALHEQDLMAASVCALEIAAVLADLKIVPGRTQADLWAGAWRVWSGEP